MPITINGSGTITGASTLATTQIGLQTVLTGTGPYDPTHVECAIFR